jgi:hypothetical protein
VQFVALHMSLIGTRPTKFGGAAMESGFLGSTDVLGTSIHARFVAVRDPKQKLTTVTFRRS